MQRFLIRRASVGALIVVSLASPAVARSQTAADRAEAAARGYDGSLTTGHFAVFWRLQEGTAEEVRQLLRAAEDMFAGISAIVGEERTPTQPILLILAGHGRAEDGTWRAPSVDDQGRVILLRYGDGIASYRQEVTHELVHAFRRHAGYWLSGFLEEGFAEAVAMSVDPDDVGFPRYGYPLTVVAGHLLARDEYLPLSLIRSRHQDLNRRCQLQSYAERASFFDYLTRRADLDALVTLVYRLVEPTDSDYVELFGGSFAELESAWESTLAAEYQDLANADAMAREYRAEPAIANRPMMCAP